MKLACEHYGKNFEGGHEKFCSNGCRHSHIASIEKKYVRQYKVILAIQMN
jgi:hypothetical protein